MTQFETKFQVCADGSLIYNLKTGRGFTRGVPNMTNDVMIRVDQQYSIGHVHSEDIMKEIAHGICDYLNNTYTFKED